MDHAKRASLEFSIDWQSHHARHQDRLHVEKIDFWRDIFPGDIEQEVRALHPGEVITRQYDSGELVPPFQSRDIVTFSEGQFETHQGQMQIHPKVGRFYPQGFAPTGLNCYQGDFTPFRLIDKNDGKMVGDKNHPLSTFPIKFQARYVEKMLPIEEHGGVCNDIAELVTQSGPGMQAPLADKETDFFSVYPFARNNELDDELFYREPRLIKHLDTTAIEQVKNVYSRLLHPGDHILDLMSSFVSHIPESLASFHASGLGMNTEELQANPQLKDHVVQNLNTSPTLPYKDNQFDAVICTASVEYLIQPIEIFKEVARVSKNEGVVVITFSDRWFPGKEIKPWSEMHPFERMGLVLDFFRKSGCYDHLQTKSVRGLPRPLDDPHIQQTRTSDPIFAVSGKVKK